MGGQSRGAPTAKRAAVQASVLEATVALLDEGASYAELNIERIATRAGISRTAFYFYFRDKRELLLAPDGGRHRRALPRRATSGSPANGEPAAELGEALANIGALYREHGAVLRAIVQAAATDDEIAVSWHRIVDRFVDATSRRIEDLQRDGKAAVREDARATAFALCWMIERAFNQQLVLGEPFREQALVDALTGIFLRAVYGADGRPA